MSATPIVPPGSATTSQQYRFPTKYVTELIICAALFLVAAGLLIRHQYWQTVEEWKNKLSSIADGEELYIRTWVYERNGDLAVLSTRPLLATPLLQNRQTVGKIAQATAMVELDLVQPLLDQVVAAYGYEAIYLVDRLGKVRAQSSGALPLPPAIAKDAQDARHAAFEVLPTSLQNQLNARMALIAPIGDGVFHGDFRAGAGKPLGGIVILTQARLIHNLPSLGTASTRSGESILIRREGDDAVFISAPRHLDSIPAERRNTLRPAPFVTSSIFQGSIGFREFRDYRGVSVLGITRVIPDVNWGLITKIDQSEALQRFYSLAAMELASVVVILTILVTLVLNVWHDRQIQGLREEIGLREKAEEELRDAHDRLTRELAERTRAEAEILRLGERLINAQEEERTRIARELHDNLSQQIAALGIALSHIKRQIPAARREAREQAGRAYDRVLAIGEGIRQLSHELHPAILEHAGLVAALESYCTEFEALAHVSVKVHADGRLGDLPTNVQLGIYRITQEALQNIWKHSGAREGIIYLERHKERVQMRISDQGIGFDATQPSKGRGLGLVSMRERARLLGGTLTVESSPGLGTTIVADIPVGSAALPEKDLG